jgi:hypothetical protein
MIDIQPLERLFWLDGRGTSEVQKQERRDKKEALRKKWCKAWIKENPDLRSDEKAFLLAIQEDGLGHAIILAKTCKWKCSRLMKVAKKVEALYDVCWLP